MSRRVITSDMWSSLFSAAFLVLGTNAMVVVAAGPLVVLSMTTDPRSSWPALSGAAVLATPAVSAAFGVFREFGVNRSTDAIRRFWRAWREHLVRSLAVGSAVVGGTVVLLVDVAVLYDHDPGALVVPLLLVLLALLWATALLTLVGGVERSGTRGWDLLKASLFLSVRRWYLTLVSFIALGTLLVLYVQFPAIALGIALSPLLYTAWANSRYTLRPVCDARTSASRT